MAFTGLGYKYKNKHPKHRVRRGYEGHIIHPTAMYDYIADNIFRDCGLENTRTAIQIKIEEDDVNTEMVDFEEDEFEIEDDIEVQAGAEEIGIEVEEEQVEIEAEGELSWVAG